MLKLVTAKSDKKNTIGITNSQSQIGQEFIRQISQHKNIDINTNPTGEENILIHLPSTNTTLLAEILSNTTHLHNLLEQAKKFKTKIFLVVPNASQAVYQTAIQLVTQYAKNYHLAYQIFEISDKNDPISSVESVLQKIIYKHKNINTPPHTPAVPKKTTPVKKEIRIPKVTLPEIKIPTIQLPKVKFPHFSWQGKYNHWLRVIIILIFSPWILFCLTILSTYLATKCSQKFIFSNQISKSAGCAQIAKISFTGSKYLSYISLGSRSLMESAGYPVVETYNVISSGANSFRQMAKINSQLEKYQQNILTPKDIPDLPSSSDMRAELTGLVETLASFQNEIRSFYTNSNHSPENLNQLAAKIVELREVAYKTQLALIDVLPIIESSTPKKIAFLIQDNNESRPSGGYLDSVALLTMQNGKISDWRVVTSDTADKQLLGSVEAPSDFKVATGQIQWYLRDSNWPLNFSESAEKASWFIQKELNETPALIIGVNLQTLGEIAQAIGQVKVGISANTLTSTNINSEYIDYLKNHSDNNDFIKTLTEKLLDKTKNLSQQQINNITSIIISNLKTGQIYISLPGKETPSLNASGWSGEVSIPKCRSAFKCIVDYFYPIDTNIGANKADYFTEKKWQVSTEISSMGITNHYVGTYKNTSTQNAWPAGNLKNYLRIILPASTTVESIKIGETQLKNNEIQFQNDHDKSILSLKLDINPSQTTTVEITTTQVFPIGVGQIHYQLDTPIQPGKSKDSQVHSMVNFPSEWFGTSYNHPVFASAGKLEYNLGAKEGSRVDIDFAISPKN